MSTTAFLEALPDPVVIDTENGQMTGSTKVKYTKESSYVIWHRWKPGDWTRKKISVSDTSDPANFHGEFDSPDLEPGDIYEAALWDKGVDPNRLPTNVDRPPQAHAATAVFALRKRPEQRSFLRDENMRTGGTYREHDVFTSVPVRAVMAVSTSAPQADANGIYSFNQTDALTYEVENESFNLQLFDLLPGTHYFEMVRLTDRFGNWQFLMNEFTTLKRRIRVKPTEILVHDDSDPGSTGEGVFRCILQTGEGDDQSQWRNRGETSVTNGDFGDNAALPEVPAEIEIGPEPVARADVAARVHASGEDDDRSYFDIGAFEAASGAKELNIPQNTTDETVIEASDEIHADLGDSLTFTMKYKYWIEYF